VHPKSLRASWRGVGAIVGLAFVVAAAASCGGGGGTRDTTAATLRRQPATTAPPTTTVPETVPSTTSPPDIGEVPRPANVTDDAFQWFARLPGSPNPVLLAVQRSTAPRPHPAVLLADASGGLNPDYLTFADELVAQGFDVAVGCLFTIAAGADPTLPTIPCPDSPPPMGVLDASVPDLDAVVGAAHEAFGASTPLAVMGFSRSGGIAALRASTGRPEAVVLVSGKYEGFSNLDPEASGEVNIVERGVTGWRVPTLILHGTADAAIPVAQAHDLEAALLAAGAPVEAHYYEGAGHNLSGEPAVHDNLVATITQFLCARLGCAA
jgi:dienelactone hydrolase